MEGGSDVRRVGNGVGGVGVMLRRAGMAWVEWE